MNKRKILADFLFVYLDVEELNDLLAVVRGVHSNLTKDDDQPDYRELQAVQDALEMHGVVL